MRTSTKPLPFLHLHHLVGELRAVALSAFSPGMLIEAELFDAGFDAALANDAADAIETLLSMTFANDNVVFG